MNPCELFRRALEVALGGELGAQGLTALGWHEHLVGCDACRTILEQEEALELLLSSLPEPELPPELASRVLACLRSRRPALDRLLALDQVQVPDGLPLRVLAAVGERTADERLDLLLDRAGALEAPPGLSARVLSGLAAERAASTPRGALRLLGPGRWRVAAAAVLVLGSGLWILDRAGTGGGVSGPAAHPDDAVIAWLPALEYWDQVRELDPLEAELVIQFDDVDAVLLEEGG